MKRILHIIREGTWGAILVSLIALGVYGTTMCPTVSFTDTGELAAVVSNLGIAHPTGYPLFTLLGRCMVMLPVHAEAIIKLNVFAALLTALAVGCFYLLIQELNRFIVRPTNSTPRREGGTSLEVRLIGMASALSFAFSTTVWSQSVALEVYALHLLLLIATLAVFISAINDEIERASHLSPKIFLFAFLLGLSFSNHMTTIMILPACFYLYFVTHGWRWKSFRGLLKILPFFVLGITPYAYLLIRSRAIPPNDWGHPATIERFLWHLSGKQYSSWMFSGIENAEKQLKHFITGLPLEFNYLALLLGLIGSGFLFKRSRELFYFLLIAFLSCLALSVNYDIHDIDSYFLLAFTVIGCFVFLGLETLSIWLTSLKWRTLARWALIAFFILPILQIVSNKSGVDESDNFLLEDYTSSLLDNVDSNAVVISYQWDYFVGPCIYYQNVRHKRADVTVVDKELLRRSWYFIQLERHHPWLVTRSRDKIERFLTELYKFEHDLPFNPNVIELRYVEMMNDLIDQSLNDRPVYVGPEIEQEFGSKYARIPVGNVFRLSGLEGVRSGKVQPPRNRFRKTSFSSYLSISLKSIWARMLTLNATYWRQAGDERVAEGFIEEALKVSPGFQPALQMRRNPGDGGDSER